jgi:hypothetical protein
MAENKYGESIFTINPVKTMEGPAGLYATQPTKAASNQRPAEGPADRYGDHSQPNKSAWDSFVSADKSGGYSQKDLRDNPSLMGKYEFDAQRNAGGGGTGSSSGGTGSQSSTSSESSTAAGLDSIDIDGKEGASEARAAITREQWEDYKLRFLPYEDRLAAIYKNGGLMKGEAEKIPESINQSFDAMQGIADRQLSRYGITASEDQVASRERMSSLDKAMASVDAHNNLWATADERQDKIMTGGIDSMRQEG